MTEGAALIEGQSARDGLTARSAEPQTTVAALTTRAHRSVAVYHKRTVLARFHLRQHIDPSSHSGSVEYLTHMPISLLASIGSILPRQLTLTLTLLTIIYHP